MDYVYRISSVKDIGTQPFKKAALILYIKTWRPKTPSRLQYVSSVHDFMPFLRAFVVLIFPHLIVLLITVFRNETDHNHSCFLCRSRRENRNGVRPTKGGLRVRRRTRLSARRKLLANLREASFCEDPGTAAFQRSPSITGSEGDGSLLLGGKEPVRGGYSVTWWIGAP